MTETTQSEASTEVVEVPSARRIAAKAQTIDTIAAQSGWIPEEVAKGHVLIFPSYVRQISEMHQVKLEMVTVDPAKDLYTFDGKFAATKGLLERMGSLAGIEFDATQFEYPEPGVLVAKARGGVRGPDGLISYVNASKEWIKDVVLVEIEGRADALMQATPPKLTAAYRDTWIRQQMAHEMKERGTKTETKAKNRVRREALGLPGAEMLPYWQKPFFIPRIDILIDATNPEIRKHVYEDAFGGRKLLGLPQPTIVHDVEVIREEASAS